MLLQFHLGVTLGRWRSSSPEAFSQSFIDTSAQAGVFSLAEIASREAAATAERMVLVSSHSSGFLWSLSGCLNWWAGGTASAVAAVVWGMKFMEGQVEAEC